MSDIILQKLDNNFIKIHASESISRQLYEHFSFFADGYLFNYLFINKLWDGKIRLYKKSENKIYLGLTNELIKFAKQYNYDIKLDPDLIKSLTNFDYNELKVNEYLNSLNISDKKSNEIQLRNYQRELIHHAIKNNRMTCLSATASGKSLIIYCIIRYYLDNVLNNNDQIILIVPSVNLVEQMYSDFCEYSQLNDFNVFKNVGKIYAGQDKNSNHPIKISTWQSLKDEPKKYFKNIKLLLVDETHKAKAKELTKIIENCVNADYRFGLTGTIDNKNIDKLTINGLLGRIKQFVTTKELIDQGDATKPIIHIHILNHSKIENDHKHKFVYSDEVELWRDSEERKNYVCDLVGKHCDKNTMILAKNVPEYIIPLSEQLKKTFPERQVYVIHGGVKGKNREQIRLALENTNNSILVCSYETVGTGFSVKNLHNIIFAQGAKSYIKVIQAIGRGIRLSEGKKFVNIYDLVDFCKGQEPFSYLHGKERLQYYKKEGHDYKIMKFTL